MNSNEQNYISVLKKSVYETILREINAQTIEHIVTTDLYRSHIENKKSLNFQIFYFETLNNEALYLISPNFFRQFKHQYSLQGIDNQYLDSLESQKEEILNLIHSNKLTDLYFDKFSKAQIKHGDTIIKKDLGSFFAKLVHTFNPNEYCALDNPIKDYFGLSKESFFISFLIISSEYKHWALDNKLLISELRKKFKLIDKEQILRHESLTDLKLLDLIFWSKANMTK